MKKQIIIALLACCGFTATAQNTTLRTSYFMDRMNMRHKLNPALVNEQGYFTLLGLSGVQAGVSTNLGVGTLLYPSEDGKQLNSMLHPDVTSKEVEARLNAMNTIDENLELSLFSFGFFGMGGYNTFDLSLKQMGSFGFSKDIFLFMKNGMNPEGETTYNMGVAADVKSYTELALGHAHPINDRLTAGIKLKGLVGLGTLNGDVNMGLTMSADQWRATSHGAAQVALLGLNKSPLDDDFMEYVGGYDLTQLKLGGLGFAMDLGVTYRLFDDILGVNDNLTLSAAVTDLGFINWNNMIGQSVKGGEIVYEGFEDVDIENMDVESQLDDLMAQAEEMIVFNEGTLEAKKMGYLNATFTAGAEYSLFNDRIALGALFTNHFGAVGRYTELMGSLNLRPFKWFNLALSGTTSNFGSTWGVLFNYSPRYFINFYAGVESLPVNVTPQFLPIDNASLNLNVGFSIPLGGRPSKMRPFVQKPVAAVVPEVATPETPAITDEVKEAIDADAVGAEEGFEKVEELN